MSYSPIIPTYWLIKHLRVLFLYLLYSASRRFFYACEIGIMSNNRVEVHVGAKTSDLKKGMNDAEKIVSDGAKRIEDTGNKVKFKLDFSNIKTGLDDVTKNISNRFEDIGKSISGNLAKNFAAVGVGIAASVGTAVIGLASLTSEVGRASKEVEIQARLANTTTK